MSVKKKKTVAIIGTNGIPANYGGYETLSEFLVENLNEKFDFIVYCSKDQKKKENGIKTYKGARLKHLPFKANGWQSIIYDVLSILIALFRYDILLVLGAPGGFAFFLNFFFRKKIILNHGGLTEWERTKYNKIARWWGFNSRKVATKFTTYDIGDNPFIISSIKHNFGVDAELIEYGGDHAKVEKYDEKDIEMFPFLKTEYFVSVSRAEPDNRIDEVIEAFKSVPNKKVVIVSNWHVSEYGKSLLIKNKNKYENIVLLDAIYDKRLLNVVRSNAKAYIHSHSYCGTAPSLVEAMYLNLAIISYDVPTNRYTTKGKAFFYSNFEELANIVLTVKDNEFIENQTLMSQISKERYTWKRISGLYSKLFIN